MTFDHANSLALHYPAFTGDLRAAGVSLIKVRWLNMDVKRGFDERISSNMKRIIVAFLCVANGFLLRCSELLLRPTVSALSC